MINLLYYKHWTDKQKYIITYKEVLCLKECNYNFWGIWGIGYPGNNNLVAIKETGESLIKIYV